MVCSPMEYSDSEDTSLSYEAIESSSLSLSYYFIDDTATGATINTLKADQRDIFEQLQFIEQLHSDILFSLGHKLAIDKCSFYAADFQRGKLKHE